jgi:hypothetical protein
VTTIFSTLFAILDADRAELDAYFEANDSEPRDISFTTVYIGVADSGDLAYEVGESTGSGGQGSTSPSTAAPQTAGRLLPTRGTTTRRRRPPTEAAVPGTAEEVDS